jgi:hypothetical protein
VAVALGAPLVAWLLGYPGRRDARISALPPPTVALDVRASAAVARRIGRNARATQASGLVTIVVGLLPFTWPIGLLMVPVGIIMALGGTLVFRRRAGLVAPRAVTAGRRQRVVGVVLLIVTGVLGLVACFALVGVVPVMTIRRQPLVIGTGEPVAATTLSSGYTIAGFAALACAVFSYRAGRRAMRADAAEQSAADPRPPIVYLRSFADDKARVPSSPSPRRPLLETLSLRRLSRPSWNLRWWSPA